MARFLEIMTYFVLIAASAALAGQARATYQNTSRESTHRLIQYQNDYGPLPEGIHECSFYLKLEQITGCGEQGYPKGFGYKYCEGFKAAVDENLFSDKAKPWVEATAVCLQQALYEDRKRRIDTGESVKSCEELYDFAMSSHVACYVEPLPQNPEVSVCDLDKKDYEELMSVIQDSLEDPNMWFQAHDTKEACAARIKTKKSNFIERIFGRIGSWF